ncbi:MAG: MFS transporter [Candidatus Nanopelagicaceae bacterium]|jgi:Major Facilitator Superfamily|nr:MFS transporter [Candidatus Nanopelagicaceae bacterium]
MKQYLELLKIPMARKLLIAATPARMAYSMIGLSIFFKTERTLDSIPLAGLALGLNALAGSLTAGIRGSAIDKWGQKWPIRILVPGYAFGIIALNIASTKTEILIWAFVLGFSAPPINLSVRPLWKQIVGEKVVRTAYGLDTAVMNGVGIIGPAIATTISLSSRPGFALGTCAALMIIGGIALEFTINHRNWFTEKKDPSEAKLWKVPAIRLLMIEGCFIGLGWGFFDVGIPAYTTLENVPHRTAWLFSIMSLCNVIGGLIAGLIKKRRSAFRTMRATYFGWFVFSLPLYFTYPDWSLAVVGALLGLTGGALQVFYFEVLDAVRPQGSATASLGWLWTIEGSMAALGSALGGWVAEAISPQFCLGVTTLALAIGFALLNIGRRRFAAADVVLEG